MEFFQSNEVIMLLTSALITGLVQISKKIGINPFLALAVLSIIASGVYEILVLRLSSELNQAWTLETLQIAAVANLIYNILKPLIPALKKMIPKME